MRPDVLVRLRESRALTQHEAAELIGVSQRQFARWEAGDAIPGPKNLRAIAAAFSVSVTDLDEQPEPDDLRAAIARIERRLERIETRLDQLT